MASARPRAPAQTKAKTRAKPQTKSQTKASASGATVFIALLRGINVGGNKRVPMQTLRALAGKLGFRHVETYIQSGNLVFAANVERADAEAALERTLAKEFGFSVDVVVRSERQWRAYAARSAFAEAESERPHLLLLGVSKRPALAGAQEKLGAFAKAGERVHVLADALWIDFPAGIARSKLSPAVLDRALGSSVTARNWRTVQKLAEMAAVVAGLEKSGPA